MIFKLLVDNYIGELVCLLCLFFDFDDLDIRLIFFVFFWGILVVVIFGLMGNYNKKENVIEVFYKSLF